MKDMFGNRKPVQIEEGEWWFNGRIIQKQDDFRLPKWISFEDNNSPFVQIHSSKKEAIDYALENPCLRPKNMAADYL